MKTGAGIPRLFSFREENEVGYFSWLTGDTKESIPVAGYEYDEPRPVFMLRPFGMSSYREDSYDGYGNFGGKDAYELLAEMNLNPDIAAKMSESDLRSAGVALGVGNYYEDSETGRKYAFFHEPFPGTDVEWIRKNYSEPLQQFEMKSANDLIDEGRLIRRDYREAMKFPLKFSFDPNAEYEKIGESVSCPDQGFMYERKMKRNI